MNKPVLLLVTYLGISSAAGDAAAADDDRAAVLAVVAQAFAAVHSGNPDDWRAIQLADGVSLSLRQDPNGEPGKQLLRLQRNEAFAAALTNDGHDYREHWTAEPTVMIRGPIAVVWGEYEFSVDGNFSHCGVDSVDLVKQDGEWKIANFMWTVEKSGCRRRPAT